MESDIDRVVTEHLACIARRDLDAYLRTVHDQISIILPNGRLVSGREEAAELHAAWFAEPGWTFEPVMTHREVVGDTAVFLCEVDYRDGDSKDGDGEGEGDQDAVRFVLSLVFTRTREGWLLLHDQNTYC